MSDSILTGLNFIIQRNLRDFLDRIKIKFSVATRRLTYLVYGQRIMSARVSDLQPYRELTDQARANLSCSAGLSSKKADNEKNDKSSDYSPDKTGRLSWLINFQELTQISG